MASHRPILAACAALAVAVLALMPAGAAAQYFGRNKVQYRDFDFKVLGTQHFDVYYYEEERAVAEEAARMAERWYQRLSRALDHELTGRQPLILYASHPHFEQTNAIFGELDESTGGVTEFFKRRIVLPASGSLAQTDHVIGHELVHAFQFDLRRSGQRSPFEPGIRLPLWFVEGMAEYLSVGAVDPHTAMWMRDAARSDRLPRLAKLDNPRYFPYRYGHAFWAYVAATWGEASVGEALKYALMRGLSAERALEVVLGISADSLSRDWHRAIRTWDATVAAAQPEPTSGRVLIQPRGLRGRLNLGPSVSPDGSRVAFLSERDAFSIEMFVADTRTGKVLRRLTRSAVDPHLQSLQFIHSAGGWSPDGGLLAVATVVRGRPTLTVIDARKGRTVQQVPFPGLGEIYNPTWSPDGRRVAFSAMVGGGTDLFVVELESGALERLTEDLFADLQPAWSPDGRTIAFVTDRFTSALPEMRYGELRLALLDLETRGIREVPGAAAGKSINPQWAGDGLGLFFVSDRSGISNVYRVSLASGEVTQVSDVATGVSGITPLSPALSVARGADVAVFSLYQDGGYRIVALETEAALAGRAPRAFEARVKPGQLPPVAREADAVAAAPAPGDSLVDPATFSRSKYRAGLSLDYVAQGGVSLSAGASGLLVGGGSALYWSDMLGNHNLATLLQISSAEGGIGNNLGAVVAYQNRRTRANWGITLAQIPYFTRVFDIREGRLGNEPVLSQRDFRAWQIDRSIEGIVAYPLNRAQRVEFAAGFRNIDFRGEVQELIISRVTGALLQDITRPSADDSIPSLNLFSASSALVYDNSIFGGTSPVLGQRYRFEVAPVAGDLQFVSLLADFRRYTRLPGPFSLAGRVVHIGRYGRDSESDRIAQYFVGYPWLVRGYDAPSFTLAECEGGSGVDCPAFDQLFGSRMGLANLELRLPLFGALGVIPSPAVPPVEAAAFYDVGVAWTERVEPRFLGGEREAVSSYGTTLRINVLGFAVAEIAYVHPNDRPRKGWYWVFGLQPGF